MEYYLVVKHTYSFILLNLCIYLVYLLLTTFKDSSYTSYIGHVCH